jgi:hypothetical protein
MSRVGEVGWAEVRWRVSSREFKCGYIMEEYRPSPRHALAATQSFRALFIHSLMLLHAP